MQLSKVDEVLNIHALHKGRHRTLPFRWSTFDSIFTNVGLARHLASRFPKAADRYERSEGAKPLSYGGVRIGKTKDSGRSDIDPVWYQFRDLLDGDEFRSAISSVSEVDLSSAVLDIGLYTYGTNDFFSAHTDRSTRLVSVLFYLTEGWSDSWGGRLRILNSSNEDDLFDVVTPSFNTAAMIVRSPNSWHSVEKVSRQDVARRVVNVNFLVRGATMTGAPVVAWRKDESSCLSMALEQGLELLVHLPRSDDHSDLDGLPNFSSTDVSEIIYRQYVPLVMARENFAARYPNAAVEMRDFMIIDTSGFVKFSCDSDEAQTQISDYIRACLPS